MNARKPRKPTPQRKPTLTRTPRREWTEDDDQQIIEMHRLGYTINTIARTLKRSPGTISTHAKKLGLTWIQPEDLQQATEISRQRRALRADFLAEQADFLARSMYRQVNNAINDGKYLMLIKEQGGGERLSYSSWVPPRDYADIARAANSFATTRKAYEDALNGENAAQTLGAVDDFLEDLQTLRNHLAEEVERDKQTGTPGTP